MLKDNETTIFKFLNNGKDEVLNTKMTDLFKSDKMINLKDALEYNLKLVLKMNGDNITRKAIQAVADGRILLFYTKNPGDAMPVYMPFIKYKQAGKITVAVDLTKRVRVKKEKSGEVSIEMDIKQLYCFIVSAYLYITIFNKTDVLPTNIMKYTSMIWAKMFCRILEMKVGLATNKERHEAFMYFAMRYFLTCVLEAPEGVAKAIASSYVKTGTNRIVIYTESVCEEKGINMYQDLVVFCTTLFNKDITGLRSLYVNGSSDTLNHTFFITQYITLYSLPAALALESMGHFMWVIISSCNWAYLFNDKVIEASCTDEFVRIMNELNRHVDSY